MRSLHLEKYKGWKYKGKYSVRCDVQFRLIFSVLTSPEFILVLEEVTDPH
jgi:plasmid maintenance system killer protein